MATYDLMTFGETMLRLSTPEGDRLQGTNTLAVHVGGTESNVAVNLANLGKRTAWFSRLPRSPLGYTVRDTIRAQGVDTSHITWVDDARQGLYFVEFGAAPRSISVLYDRKHSAASQLTPDDLPFEALAASKWLHVTGITPALSISCAETAMVAVDHARAHGVQVSVDVNYRTLLWEPQAAAKALTPLCQQADVIFVARRDAAQLWGVDGEAPTTAATLQQQWGGTVIVTDGTDGTAAASDDAHAAVKSVPTRVVDRLGAGDALASGVLYGLMEGASLTGALTYGVTMAAFALSVQGDFARVSRDELEAYLSQTGSGLIR